MKYQKILYRATDINPLHSVALSFAVSTLYLLVQPRPKEVAPPSQVVQRGSKPIRRSYDDNYDVLMFAYVGWDVYPYMPSNSYIRNEHAVPFINRTQPFNAAET